MEEFPELDAQARAAAARLQEDCDGPIPSLESVLQRGRQGTRHRAVAGAVVAAAAAVVAFTVVPTLLPSSGEPADGGPLQGAWSIPDPTRPVVVKSAVPTSTSTPTGHGGSTRPPSERIVARGKWGASVTGRRLTLTNPATGTMVVQMITFPEPGVFSVSEQAQAGGFGCAGTGRYSFEATEAKATRVEVHAIDDDCKPRIQVFEAGDWVLPQPSDDDSRPATTPAEPTAEPGPEDTDAGTETPSSPPPSDAETTASEPADD